MLVHDENFWERVKSKKFRKIAKPEVKKISQSIDKKLGKKQEDKSS